MRRVCVFCGSSAEVDPSHLAFAAGVGAALGQRGFETVYGGARAGLMGAVANGAKAHGGRVYGVIPQSLAAREVAHESLDELVTVDSMHLRKNLMIERADAFLALPGGFGTLDELFEVLTLRQVGVSEKPVAIANPGGYYDPLLQWISRAISERFVPAPMREVLVTLRSLDDVHAWLAGMSDAPSPRP